MTDLRELLVDAVERHRCEAILLSGGLDTSIVATLGAPRGLRLAVTVVVGDAPDLPYATEIATRLGLEHVVLRRTLREHLAYYRMYREVFGGPPQGDPALPKECPGCHARGPEGTYCTVCGAYPI